MARPKRVFSDEEVQQVENVILNIKVAQVHHRLLMTLMSIRRRGNLQPG